MIIFFISILGLIFRLVMINQSFWLDEGASIEIASRPFIQLVSQMKSDFHPPLYYLLLKYWLPLSVHQDWLIRLPNVIVGVLSIPALYLLSKEIQITKNKYLIYLPAFLLAINPYHIYYSQELRMYGLNTLLTLVSWLYFIKLIKKPNQTNIVVFTLITTLNLYTFYGAFFNILAQLGYSIIFKKEIRKISLCLTMTIFLFLPWLPILFEQFKTGGYLTAALPGWRALSGSLTLKDLFLIPVKFIIGRVSLEPKAVYYLVGGIATLFVGSLTLVSLRNKKSTPVWLFFATPLFCALIISLKTPILGYWRYTSILPALLLLVSIGIDELKIKYKYLSIILLVSVFLVSNIYFWTNPRFHREDWRNAAKYISNQNASIILNFPITIAPLKYYLPEGKYYYSQAELGKIRESIEEDLALSVKNFETVFVLDYLSDLTDPSRKVLSILKDSPSLKLIQEKTFEGVGSVYQFQRVK